MNNYEKIMSMNIEQLTHYILQDLTLMCRDRKCDTDCYVCTRKWLDEEYKPVEKVIEVQCDGLDCAWCVESDCPKERGEV